MAIWHDAYLFDPLACAHVLSTHTSSETGKTASYTKLRDAALEAYETSPMVRRLASEYGSWDREGLTTQLLTDFEGDLHDAAFWLTLLVYGGLRNDVPPLGLGDGWKILEDLLASCSWDQAEINLLTQGRAFDQLFDEVGITTKTRNARNILNYIRPSSQNGSMGWIDLPNAVTLGNRLELEQKRIKGRAHIVANSLDALNSAAHLLRRARETASGLCLILSG